MSARISRLPADGGSRKRVITRGARLASVLIWGWFVALLLLGLGVRWGLRHSKPLVLDEYQHLHIAWCCTQGLTPFRDFWDNHPPGLHLVLAWLQSFRGETTGTILLARSAMFALALGLFGVVYGLSSAAFGRFTGLAAMALLSCSWIFTRKMVEIRPDSGLIVFGVLSTWLFLRALQARSPATTRLCCAAAGLALGAATLFSTKSMMLAAALLVALIGLAVRHRHTLRLKTVLGGIAWAAIGFLTAVVPLGVYFAARGGLRQMLRFTVWENLTYPERFSALGKLGGMWSMPLAAAVGLGVLLAIIEQFRDSPRRDAALLLLLAAAALVVQYLFVMPAPYPSSACLPAAFLVVLGGWGLRSVIGMITSLRRSTLLACCGGCAALLFAASATADSLEHLEHLRRFDANQALRQQLRETRRLLRLTGPGDAIFARCPVAVFRRHACFYPTLVNAVLRGFRDGTIEPTIAEDLRRFQCTLIVMTTPPTPIPPDDEQFIRTHFVTFAPSLLVPGQRYWVEQLRAGPVAFDAVTAGLYRVETAAPVLVDGRTVAAEVFLVAGPHSLDCPRASGPVIIYRRPGQPPNAPSPVPTGAAG